MQRQESMLAFLLAVLMVLSLAIAPPQTSAEQNHAEATPAQSTGATVNLTTTVYDFDATGVSLLMRSDDYNGIGQATYTTISGNRNSPILFSGIDASGDWRLTLFNQSTRTLWITPNNPINTLQPAGPPAGYYWQNVEAYSVCYDQDLNIIPFQNLLNGSNNCSLGVDFSSNNKKYKLVMSPHLPALGPATGMATVICNAVSNNQCVDWTITPNTATANATAADLFYFDKKGSLVFVGQYYNTFRINASNP